MPLSSINYTSSPNRLIYLFLWAASLEWPTKAIATVQVLVQHFCCPLLRESYNCALNNYYQSPKTLTIASECLRFRNYYRARQMFARPFGDVYERVHTSPVLLFIKCASHVYVAHHNFWYIKLNVIAHSERFAAYVYTQNKNKNIASEVQKSLGMAGWSCTIPVLWHFTLAFERSKVSMIRQWADVVFVCMMLLNNWHANIVNHLIQQKPGVVRCERDGRRKLFD